MSLVELRHWLYGDLSAPARIWTALAPALFLGSYFFVGLAFYLLRIVRRGSYHDAEIEARGSSFMIGMGPRNYLAWVMGPVWFVLKTFQIPANAITTLSVFLASASGIAIAVGRFSLGGWLYLFAGVCDFLDGRLARETGQAGPAGAALDSVLDRYAESAVLVGLAWFYRESWVLLAVLATLVGSGLVPYIRARGEGLGVDVKVGLMQRPERLVLLGITVAFSPIIEAILVPSDPRPFHRLAVLGIIVLAVTTHLTAFKRLIHVVRLLQPEKPPRKATSLTGEGSLFRTTIAALVATGTDFLVVEAIVQLALSRNFSGSAKDTAVVTVATALGCLVGGIINFTINRAWTFASKGRATSEASRYGFVSATSALLNSGGVHVLLLLPGLHYRLAWVLVRGAVFLAWNYPLQRDFVFGRGPPHSDNETAHPAG